MSGIQLLLDGNRGQYIPRDFILECYSGNAKWSGLTEGEQVDCTEPDRGWYWDSWDQVLNNAMYTDEQGHKWSLYQDSDLWAVCEELMTDEEYEGFYGQERE